MGANSKISWTDHTFNPWIGCTKVSEGCKNCYAAENFRFSQHFGPEAERHVTSESYWKQPLKWNKKAEAEGVCYKVFCGSLCDVFEHGDIQTEMRYELFKLIAKTPHLDWLLLTKRPEEAVDWYDHFQDMSISKQFREEFPSIDFPNIWLGVSVENQEQADKRIPELLKIPAKVRFLSCEPLLDMVMLDKMPNEPLKHIDWVIAGGESGKNRRTMNMNHLYDLKWQCLDAGVPFFCKQDSAFKPGQQGRIPDWLWEIKQFPEVNILQNENK